MNYLLVSYLLGIIVVTFSLSLLTTVPFALWYNEYNELIYILESMGAGLLFGGVLLAAGWKEKGAALFRRESLAVVGLSWLFVAAVGALPFRWGGMMDSYTDAYFESMSGLTTTGASVLQRIEGQAHALLFWRSFLHFLGGLGIVVFFVAILPFIGVGGKSLFKQEVPGPVPEGMTPRIKDTAIALCKIYIALNVAEMVLLKMAGMSYFDAINHAFATMATGGFSTKNNSIAAFNPAVEWIIVVFMFLAGTNFSLHLRFSQGHFLTYFRSSEFRTYLGLTVGISVAFAVILWWVENPAVSHPGYLPLRDGFFTTLAVKTTTGFGTVDFDQWPPGCKVMLLMLMFIGGSAGSTAGGIKVVRFIILIKSGLHLLRTEVAPRRVTSLKIDNQVLDPRVQKETFGFFFIYITIFILSSAGVAYLMPGQNMVTSVTAVIACLNNIGPGLEAVGPTMNYAMQSPATKWVLSLLMVMGRLELYAILVLLAPRFWFPK